MAGKVVIRKAGKKDIEDLNLLAGLFESYLNKIVGKRDRAQLAERRRSFRTRQRNFARYGFGRKPAFNTLIAKMDGKAVGYACYSIGYDADEMLGMAVYLLDLFVIENLRGKGVGTKLMKELAGICKKNEAIGVYFLLWDRNRSGIRFYDRIGASQVKGMRFMQWRT